MDKLGWEVFELPSAPQWRMLLLNAGMGTLFNVSFVAAVSLLSPTLVSVSCLLTVPIAAMADLFLNHYRDADEQVKKFFNILIFEVFLARSIPIIDKICMHTNTAVNLKSMHTIITSTCIISYLTFLLYAYITFIF